MPYLQRRRLVAAGDISGDDPYRYKLPRTGLFTGFEIELRCQRANTRTLNTVCYPLETQLTKIEMLRGGTRPIISITGPQLDALNYWDFKRPNARRYRQEDATEERLKLFLLAGRNLYDREYLYDMSKLGETYVEIDHALTADATDYFDVSTSLLDIYAYQWMGGGIPSAKGYFRSRQLASWTTTASDAIKVIEIPVANPIRRMAVQSTTRAATIGGAIKEMEVRVNDGEYSPVHIKSPMRWVLSEVSEYGLSNVIGGLDYGVAGTIMDFPYWWGYYQEANVVAYGLGANYATIYGGITNPARFYADLDTAGAVMFHLRGYGFQKCLRIGFDHHFDGFDLLPTAGLGALDLILTENAASKAVRVFVQDVISY